MNTVRTVSDTKRSFYSIHTRPVSSVYRRVVEELMVEIHLLRVNEDFRYDPLFALGVVTTFDRFMEGYEPSSDRESIFKALCRSEEMEPERLRADAEMAKASVQGQSADDLLAWVAQSATAGGTNLAGTLSAIAHNPKFKYSRLFAIGLYTLIEGIDAGIVSDETKLNEYVDKLVAPLNLSASKIQKDLELYRSNLDKLQQARQAMAEFIEGERRRQQLRTEEQQKAEQLKAEAATATSDPTTTPETPPESDASDSASDVSQ